MALCKNCSEKTELEEVIDSLSSNKVYYAKLPYRTTPDDFKRIGWEEVPNTQSNTSVGRSNVNKLKEMFPDSPDIMFVKYDTGTEVFYYENTTDKELKETCESLFDYPALDDMDVAVDEKEQIDDAWKNWAGGEFVSALQRVLQDTEYEEKADDLDYNDFEVISLFDEAAKEAGEQWREESDGSMYIDVDKVTDHIDEDELHRLINYLY